jgi:hypothetical protein
VSKCSPFGAVVVGDVTKAVRFRKSSASAERLISSFTCDVGRVIGVLSSFGL